MQTDRQLPFRQSSWCCLDQTKTSANSGKRLTKGIANMYIKFGINLVTNELVILSTNVNIGGVHLGGFLNFGETLIKVMHK